MAIGCAQPTATAWLGAEGLAVDQAPGSVDFFLTYRGNATSCSECLLVELVEGSKRIAYYVEPESSCRLVRGDAMRAEFEPFQDKYVVSLILADSGIQALSKCASRGSDSDFIGLLFLIVADGKPVGDTRVDRGLFSIRRFPIFGTLDIEVISDVLDPGKTPTIEL